MKKLRRELDTLLHPPAPARPALPAGLAEGGGAAARPGGSSASLVQSSLDILERNKEKGDPEQIVAALRACIFDARV